MDAGASTSDRDPTSGEVGPLLPGLPDDVASLCLSHVPPHHHPTLSLLSRSHLALLRSSAFFDLRRPHPLLLLSLRTPSSHLSFFLLHPLSSSPLVPLPPPPIPTLGAASASSGPFLFLLGGSVDNLPRSSVQIFDLRFRRWSLGPRLSTPRQFAAAAVVNSKIYVIGGCSPVCESWAEVMDVGGERWTDVESPEEVRQKWMHGNVVVDGRIFAVTDRGVVVFDPERKVWGGVPVALDSEWKGRAAVVGGVIYSYDFMGKIKGFDLERDEWRVVEGVERELPKFLAGAAMADVGGRLNVVWEGRSRSRGRGRGRGKELELSFAEIELAKESGGGLRGRVVWTDSVVLSLPKASTIAHCLAVEV